MTERSVHAFFFKLNCVVQCSTKCFDILYPCFLCYIFILCALSVSVKDIVNIEIDVQFADL